MKISTIPHLYRNVKRWTEIISVLSKYGLADWISRLNIDLIKTQLKDREGESLALQTPEKRIRLALTDLGPTFIKLGQLLSTRPDLVGVPLADELQQLRDDVPADPPVTVRKLIESELGQTVDELFVEFEDTPIASASIGQVHRARLQTGESVAVKIQHARIEKVVREDLEVLAGLAILAERIPEFAHYRPRKQWPKWHAPCDANSISVVKSATCSNLPCSSRGMRPSASRSPSPSCVRCAS